MEKLFELAMKKASQVEIFEISEEDNSVEFENYSLTNISSTIQSGLTLRIIKDGLLGVSYTKNLTDRQELLEKAMESLKGQVEASYTFPGTAPSKKLDTYSKEIESLSNEHVVKKLKNISTRVKAKCDGQLNSSGGYGRSKLRIKNSSGLDVTRVGSYYFEFPHILFPGSYANIGHRLFKIGPGSEDNNDKIDEMIDLYQKGMPELSPKSGPLEVIFTPDTIYTLLWRVKAGTSAKAIYEGISPIKDKMGEDIFSKELNIFDDPHMPDSPLGRTFDDEGVLTNKLPIIENGKLSTFYNSLEYAKKLNMAPTGNGYREAMWGGDAISCKPVPSLKNVTISPGKSSFSKMIKDTKRGILLCGVLGAHSGNIPNGDFSVGLNPGLYIEDGQIKGRVKDGMIAGNIYQLMKQVKEIENKVHKAFSGAFPAISFYDVTFSSK